MSFTLICDNCGKEIKLDEQFKNGKDVAIYTGEFHGESNTNIDCTCGNDEIV